MSGFTKDARQRIVREFALKHGGRYEPAEFVAEVRKTGKKHPAWDWFEWSTEKAAQAYWLEQARDFARDLRVVFNVKTVAGGTTKVRAEMPMVMSPMVGRSKGGGYVLSNPNDPRHMTEFCRQAASDLSSWLSRYKGALLHAGIEPASVEQNVKRLLNVGAAKKAEAA